MQQATHNNSSTLTNLSLTNSVPLDLVWNKAKMASYKLSRIGYIIVENVAAPL